VRARKIRLQAASRPSQREALVAAAESSGGAAVEDAVRLILRHIGEDPERAGLKATPNRVLHALEFLTRGYQEDPKVAINGAVFS
jgi:GTP cyclohydrolase I